MPFDRERAQAGASWSRERARRLYNLSGWGGGFFDIGPQGRVIARSRRDAAHPGIDLMGLARRLWDMGLAPPVLVRLHHILHERVEQLQQAFAQAMSRRDYPAPYTAVYPIKVNQQRGVVDQILHHRGGRVGLEAGSKPELLAVMALLDGEDGVIVCNGYKDREYIRLALIGRGLGHRIYIVIEKPSELERVIQEARALDIEPLLGMRVRLGCVAKGKWQDSGGERAKFGFTAAQALAVLQRLRAAGLLGKMQLMHCHMGSQIPDLEDIRRGLREGARYYAALCEGGAGLRVLDIGGGLGVDYEGTGSKAYCSCNYTVEAYADAVIGAIDEICRQRAVARPEIITEAGRAMTAHHAVLITRVLDVEAPSHVLPARDSAEPEALIGLRDLYSSLRRLPVQEAYQRADALLGAARLGFEDGRIGLGQRAACEQLFALVCASLLETSRGRHGSAIDADLRLRVAAKYFCNFSIFQSVPDVWAFNQLFPIMPLHRLDEPPTERAIIHDLTCDSDGQIQAYVGPQGVESTLALHRPRPGEPYLLGVFLVGAYQEILGDEHNLFGHTHSVDVSLQGEGGYRLSTALRGEGVEGLLRGLRYDTGHLLDLYRHKLGGSPLSAAQKGAFLKELSAGLSGYTYIEH